MPHFHYKKYIFMGKTNNKLISSVSNACMQAGSTTNNDNNYFLINPLRILRGPNLRNQPLCMYRYTSKILFDFHETNTIFILLP